MNPQGLQVFLLAERGFVQDISRNVRRPPTLSSGQWIFVGVVFVLSVAGIALWSWYSERRGRPRPCNSPIRLFWSLCQAHGLRWPERWTLWQVGRYQRLTDPARLFLEPERLDRVNLSPTLRRRDARMESLRADCTSAARRPPINRRFRRCFAGADGA